MTHTDLENSYRGKKVLITGGLGFIGSSLAFPLLDLGAKVTLIDSLIPEYGGNFFNIRGIEDRLKVNISDIRDHHGLDYLVQGQDLIFNLAGTLSHIDSMRDPQTDLEINCRSQLALLESCRKHNPSVKILFAGTRGQYGKADYLPVDENHPLHPTDVNGINNMAGEWYHILYYRVHGIRTCSLRLTNTYGPRHQMRHSRQGVINWFIRQLIEGVPIRIFGDGRQKRDLNYVEDVVNAFLMAGASPKADGEIFNVGDLAISLEDIVKSMIRIHGAGTYSIVPFPAENKDIEVGDYVANTQKIRDRLSWEPTVSLESGLQKTFEYYAKNRSHYW